jgi:hypothetical protein
VHEHIGIAVAIEAQASGMVQLHPTQDQGPAGHQPVDVVAVANP